VLDSEEGAKARMSEGALLIEQRGASVHVDEHGAVRVICPLARPTSDSWGGFSGLVVIEEDVRAAIERALRFSAAVLDRLDKERRVTHVVVGAGLLSAGHRAWRTRREHEQSPNTISGFMDSPAQVVVQLDPPGAPRADLRKRAAATAEDLTILAGSGRGHARLSVSRTRPPRISDPAAWRAAPRRHPRGS
jgi:hypothetical protein